MAKTQMRLCNVIDDVSVERTESAPTTGGRGPCYPGPPRRPADGGCYSITKTVAATGESTTTEFSRGGAELITYAGEPRDITAEAQPPPTAA